MPEITIDSLGSSGEGVGSLAGLKIFVEGALPGERVLVDLIEQKKRYARGALRQIITPSPHRVQPPCPLFGRCGGCQTMHLSYEEQLRRKEERVRETLIRIGGCKEITVHPCLPAPYPLEYRNKIQLPVEQSPLHLSLGLFQKNSHKLVPLSACAIHSALGEKVLKATAETLQKWHSLIPLHSLRFVLIKSTLFTSQASLIFVTRTNLQKPLKLIGAEIQKACPELKGVLQNINPRTDNVILSPHFMTLLGEGTLCERLLDREFFVPAGAFFQVNPAQAINLYQKALELAELQPQDILIDAFCGVGTLTLLAAPHIKRSLGFECVPTSIRAAQRNAAHQKVSNAQFFCGRAEELLQRESEATLLLLNPPRTGCAPQVISALSQMASLRKVLYISCDPATLARDAALLREQGWISHDYYPFDMFPQTSHVETLTMFIRK